MTVDSINNRERVFTLGLAAAAVLFLGWAGAEPLPQVFDFASTATAQQAWAPSGGAPAAMVTDAETGRWMVVTAPFSRGVERASWLRELPLDLGSMAAVSFRIHISDADAIRSAGFYFKSGDGWYATFAWKAQAATGRVTLGKGRFVTEGTPGLWSEVEGILLSFWCAEERRDVTVRLSDFEVKRRRRTGKNLLRNGSFEVATTGDLPDCWGAGHWGHRAGRWVLDTDLWRRMWRRDHQQAVHGRHAMRLENAPDLPSVLLRTEWIAVDDAQVPCAFSVDLKADRRGLPVTISMGRQTRTVQAGQDWRRFSVAGAPGGNPMHLRCTITPSEEGVVWVDAAQLEMSAQATPHAPCAGDGDLAAQSLAAPAGSPPRVRFPQASEGRPAVYQTTVAIDEAGRFRLNGAPFIPYALGLEGLPPDAFLRDIAAAGFNAVCVQTFARNSVDQIRHVWDACTASGLHMIPWIDRGVSGEQLRQWIRALKDHPACLAWYVLDEPADPYADVVMERLRIAREADPSRPAFVNYSGRYHGRLPGDIAAFDAYPIPKKEPSVMAALTQEMVTFCEEMGKPGWVWLQATGFAYMYAREPTPLEEQCMVYLTLIHGARGLMFFAHKPLTAELWRELGCLAKEVETLSPVLCSRATAPAVEVSDERIHSCTKQHEGSTYLIAVNSCRARIDAVFSGAAVAGARTVDVLFEDRQCRPRRGRLRDGFPPYVRHVYRFERRPEPIP